MDEAVTEYREAIRLNPKDPIVRMNLGTILTNQGKLEKAIAELREVLTLAAFDGVYMVHTKLGNALSKQGKLEAAINEYREAIRLKPDDPKALNSFAWFLAASPDPKVLDPAQAIEFATKAVQLSPANGYYLNTLGIAQYRNGNWKVAIECLEKSIKLEKGLLCASGFFLAMAHWQLDEKSEARTWYDQSDEWMAKNEPDDQELLRFRVEATELLRVKEELK